MGDTLIDNSAKNNLVTKNLSVVSSGGALFQVHKIKKKSVVQFLKLQPNPISARLVLTCGCLANGSHAVRMDPLFWISALINL